MTLDHVDASRPEEGIKFQRQFEGDPRTMVEPSIRIEANCLWGRGGHDPELFFGRNLETDGSFSFK